MTEEIKSKNFYLEKFRSGDYSAEEYTKKLQEYNKELERNPTLLISTELDAYNQFLSEQKEIMIKEDCVINTFDITFKFKPHMFDYPIWIDGGTKKGLRLLSPIKCAEFLLAEINFITVGDVKQDILYYSIGYYKTGGEKLIAYLLQKITTGYQLNNNTVNEIIGHIKRTTYQDKNNLYKEKTDFVCVKNGVLNILTGELYPHSPKWKFAQQIPHNYTPNADCLKIKQFLSEILDTDSIGVLQEFVGYMLYRKYSYKKASIFVGEQNTGKTQLIKIIVALIGEENTSSLSLHKILYDRFASSNLQYRLLNFYDDLSFKDIKETGGFKIATGGGYVSAEKKFGESYEFISYAKLLFATNKISKVDDSDDDAYYGRWLIFFFNNQFDPNDVKTKPNISETLTTPEEMEGFLNWALIGLKRLLANDKFSYTRTSEENKLIMERSSNSVSAFAQDCLSESKEGQTIIKETMYQLYCEYINIYGGAKVTKEKFGRELPIKASYVKDMRKDTETKKSAHVWGNVTLNTTNTTFLKHISNIEISISLRDIYSKIPVFPVFDIKKLDDRVFTKCSICDDKPLNGIGWKNETTNEWLCDSCYLNEKQNTENIKDD